MKSRHISIPLIRSILSCLVLLFLSACFQHTEPILPPVQNPHLLKNSVQIKSKSLEINKDSTVVPPYVTAKSINRALKLKYIPAPTNFFPAINPTTIPFTTTTIQSNQLAAPELLYIKREKHKASCPLWESGSISIKYDLNYAFSYLDTDNGLNGTLINAILEDSKGRIWMGTSLGGASVWDGTDFTHYTTKEGLPSNWVEALLEDKKGQIWIATRGGGISIWDGTNFVHYTPKNGFPSNQFSSILEDRQGRIWIATRDAGAIVYTTLEDGNKGKFHHFTTKQGLANNRILCLMEDSKGHIWMGTQGGGVSVWEDNLVRNYTLSTNPQKESITSLLEDEAGQIWMGTQSNGVMVLNGTALKQYSTKHGLAHNSISAIQKDREGRIWIATDENGVSLWDGKGFTQFSEKEGLGSTSCRVLLEDSGGRMLIGTQGGGLTILDYQSFAHIYLQQYAGKNNVVTLMEDSKGRLWMGDWGDGVFVWDGKGFYTFDTNWFVTSILEGKDGKIWIGTAYNDTGVFCWNGKELIQFTDTLGLKDNSVWTLTEDKEGRIWMGRTTGLSVLDKKRYQHFTEKEGLGKGPVAALLEDPTGQIWIGTTQGGLSVWNGNKMSRFTTNEGLSSNYVRRLLLDRAGRIWAGTRGGGVSVWTPNRQDNYLEGTFENYTETEGLTSNSVENLIEDNQGNIWIATTKGLNRLSWSTVENNFILRKYFRTDGLAKNAAYGMEIDKKGQLWLSSHALLSRLDLKPLPQDSSYPEIMLHQLQTNFEAIDWQSLLEDSKEKSSNKKAQVPDLREVKFDSVSAYTNLPVNPVFPFNLNQLTLSWSGIDWSAPHKLQYSYLLEGQDKSWSPPIKENKITYRELRPGTYTFKIRAVDINGKWSNTAAYSFTIKPPWWLTWWAYGFYGIACFSLLYFVRKTELKKEKAKLIREQNRNEELKVLNFQLKKSKNDLNQMIEATSRFVPNEFLKSIGKEKITEVEVGDFVVKNVTVFFSDIRNYTALSEAMTPEKNFQFVQNFNRQINPIIIENNGFINQYLGDGVMAIFPNSADDSLRCAIKIHKSLNQYNEKRKQKGESPIQIGIGMHSGDLVMGIIGDQSRMDAATISDAVNTASRIENLTKHYGASILLSEESLEKVICKHQFHFRHIGKVQVKGKKEPVDIHECFDADTTEMLNHKLKTLPDFNNGLAFFFGRAFPKAFKAFQKVLDNNSEDRIAHLFLNKSNQYIWEGVPDDWTGIDIL